MSTMITTTDAELEAIRGRVLQLLASEGRAVHTGEIATRLQLATHQVHTAMHPAYQAGKVHFVSSEGWSLPPVAARSVDEGQERLA